MIARPPLPRETRGRGPRIVLAHGFTQNGRCWGGFADELAIDHEVVTLDLPGHGRAAAEHDDADLPTAGSLLAEAGGRAVYVGYSMGGRMLLHAALARPELMAGIVLIGATAGIDDAQTRRARRDADEALATSLLDDGLPSFLDRWLANPLFAGLPPEAACREQRQTNRPEGLAASLRRGGTGTQEPLWDRLGDLSVPTLVLVGRDDAKFTELGYRLVDRLPSASMLSLPGTHAVHLEQPKAAADAVRRFVAETHGP